MELHQKVSANAAKLRKAGGFKGSNLINTTDPLRKVETGALADLDFVFASFSSPRILKTIFDTLNNHPSVIDAIKSLSWKTNLLLNAGLGYSEETFREQTHLLTKTLYLHSYLLQGGLIETARGPQRTARCAFIPAQSEASYEFGDHARTLNGFYLFIGDITTIVIAGNSWHPAENMIEVFSNENLDDFPFKEEIPRILKSHAQGHIEINAVSMSEIYNVKKSIRKMLKTAGDLCG